MIRYDTIGLYRYQKRYIDIFDISNHHYGVVSLSKRPETTKHQRITRSACKLINK